MLTRHFQNPAIEHYSAMFRHIQNIVQHLHTRKSGILGILEYSEPFHNCIPMPVQGPVILTKRILGIFRTLTYLKPSTYLEPSQRFKIEFLAKIVKNLNYFSIVFHLRSLSGFRYLSISAD